MALFEVQGPDGKTYDVDAPDLASAVAAIQSLAPQRGGVSTNSAAVGEFEGKTAAFIDGLHNGATFGFGDNLAGAKGAVFGHNTGPDGTLSRDYSDTAGARYASERDKYRSRSGASAQNEPGIFGAGNIAGAMGPALATAPLATGGGLFGTMMRGAALGGVEGGLHGAGNADGQDVGAAALRGGLIGGLAGLGAPAAVWGGAKLARAASDPVTGMLGVGNKSKANRSIAKTVQRSGQSQDDLARAIAAAKAEGQPEFTLMDALGRSGQRTANGIVRSGDDAASAQIADFLQSRQMGQPERVSQFVDDAFGLQGQTAAQTQGAMTKARGAAADTAYSAARGNAAPVDVRGAVAAIDDRIGGMQGSGVAGDGIDAKLSGYRNRLAASPPPNGEISRQLSDFDRVLGVKQSVQDDIGAAVRAGRNNEARELGKLMAELDSALEQSSDMYRTANDGFRTASREIDAIDQGAGMARPSQRAADTTQRFGGMTPAQQQAARVGYGDRMLAQIEANKAPTANRAKAMQSPKMDAEAQTMARDPDLYQRRLARENEMWETQNTALRGSQTANNMQDIEGAASSSGGLFEAARKGANLQLGDAVAQIMRAVGPIAKGQTEQTRQLVAQALLSREPMKILGPVLKQDSATQMRRRVIEAIIRNTGHSTAN